MRQWLLLSLVVSSGCGAIVEPGHRGLLFNPRRGGLQHEVLGPGYYRLGIWGRIEDFDITYSTRKEEVHTNSTEGLALDLKLALIYRPIVSELYALDTEIGPNFYDEVVGPEFRSAARGVFAHHSWGELQKLNTKIEDEVEGELRKRLYGKHVEISSITLESVDYAREIDNAIREKLVGEQEAARNKVALENAAYQQKLALQHEAERAKLKAEAAILEKATERKLAEEQATIDKVRAENEAETRVTKARAEAEEIKLLADAHLKERKVEATTLTPLQVMMHAYDALGKLGGEGTTVMLGDFSHIPNFLFPNVGGFQNPFHAVSSAAKGSKARTLTSAATR